jgi:hypothetical protein
MTTAMMHNINRIGKYFIFEGKIESRENDVNESLQVQVQVQVEER